VEITHYFSILDITENSCELEKSRSKLNLNLYKPRRLAGGPFWTVPELLFASKKLIPSIQQLLIGFND